jgi:MFS family permease
LFSIYAAGSFGLSLETYGKYIVVTYLCSLTLAYPLGWLADKFHPVRMALFSLGAYATLMAIGYFGIVGPKSFGVVFLVHGVVSGCYFTGAAALGQMLLPKLKFAEYASASALLIALGNIVLGPAMGGLLDKLGHDYRYTFAVGGVIALLGFGATLVVYRRFMALGGPKGYVAPE